MDTKKLKLVVVGDSYTGKTSLLYSYTEQRFVTQYDTTVFDNFAITVNIDGRKYAVNLFDTAGQEDYSHLRCLSYPQTDVFLLCFSLTDDKTLDACRKTWMPEIRKYIGSRTPVLLIGTKEDLWEKEPESRRISAERARKVAEELGCVTFLPCSALTLRGLKRVFDEAFLAAIGRTVETEDETQSICCNVL